MVIQLFGHPFSSSTWKAEIALYESDTPFDFRMMGPEHPEMAQASLKNGRRAWPSKRP